MLLSMLARPGPQAAELITAQPGMLPALAGLLARSSAAKARCAFTACYAAVCFVSLCDFEVSARRVAAEPAAVSGLVGLLSVADVAPVADGGQTRVAMQAAIALVQLSGSHAQRVLQQPGIMAALACLLQHQHSTEAQCTGLDVLSALVTGLAAAAEAGASAAVRPVMQQLARQPGVMQDLVRLLTSRQESAIARVRATTVNVLHYLVFYDHATASQLVEQPAALAALAKALGSVNKDERRMAAKAFFVLSQGNMRLLAIKCQSSPAATATVLEASTRRWMATEAASRLHPGAASGLGCTGLAEILGLPGYLANAVTQQQLLPEQRGLWLTCLKLAAADLGTWVPPLQVLLAVAGICKTLPGFKEAAWKNMSAAAAAAAAAAAQGVPEAAGRDEPGSEIPPLDAAGSRSSPAGTHARASASSAATSAIDLAGVLLMGRALHAAGRALLQMHKQPGIVAVPLHRRDSSSPDQPWRLAAFALHKLAALPGSSVSPEQQLSITAVPAGLLRSSRDWMMRQEGLGALMHMVQPVPVHAGDRAARQLAALPGFICDVVQLLASTPAADEASAMRAIFVVRRLMDHDDHGSCRAEVIAQLAADKAAVAAIVRTMNCSDADFGSMTCEVFMLLARGQPEAVAAAAVATSLRCLLQRWRTLAGQ
ncbi:hypothetical protein OEZ86_004887 [Tetradesmus obliquus]|nr:hypothetical protein OEZ86_004887 [Tetradesmus obliquus]